MAYLRTSLVVLTLLQLCRAEISDKQPESWYAANVINDGFQPKPISEIFSTEASFSSTNPIIVLSKSHEIPDEIALLSTLPPPTRLQSSTIPEGFTSIPPTMSTPSSLPTEPPLISSTSQSPAAPASSTITVQFQTSQQQKTVTSQPTIAQPAATTTAPASTTQTFAPTLNTVSTMSTSPTTSTVAITTKRTTEQSTIVSSQNTSSLTPISVTTPIPRTLTPFSAYPLRIRVVAPPGSITNIRLNPTTTTKKPKTLRTRKPKPKARRNSYDVCIDSCKGRRDPICAASLSPGLIDPNNLKGFPSICHMACHNSFKKDVYEKLVDGRCGKLRTRIRTVDSNTKLKRDELNKAVYTLDNTGPSTIVEVSGSI